MYYFFLSYSDSRFNNTDTENFFFEQKLIDNNRKKKCVCVYCLDSLFLAGFIPELWILNRGEASGRMKEGEFVVVDASAIGAWRAEEEEIVVRVVGVIVQVVVVVFAAARSQNAILLVNEGTVGHLELIKVQRKTQVAASLHKLLYIYIYVYVCLEINFWQSNKKQANNLVCTCDLRQIKLNKSKQFDLHFWNETNITLNVLTGAALYKCNKEEELILEEVVKKTTKTKNYR